MMEDTDCITISDSECDEVEILDFFYNVEPIIVDLTETGQQQSNQEHSQPEKQIHQDQQYPPQNCQQNQKNNQQQHQRHSQQQHQDQEQEQEQEQEQQHQQYHRQNPPCPPDTQSQQYKQYQHQLNLQNLQQQQQSQLGQQKQYHCQQQEQQQPQYPHYHNYHLHHSQQQKQQQQQQQQQQRHQQQTHHQKHQKQKQKPSYQHQQQQQQNHNNQKQSKLDQKHQKPPKQDSPIQLQQESPQINVVHSGQRDQNQKPTESVEPNPKDLKKSPVSDHDLMMKLKEQGNMKFRSNNLNEAVRLYREAGYLAKKLDHKDMSAIIHFNLAMSYDRLGSYNQAADECAAAVRIDDKYMKAHCKRAEIYMSQGKFEEAVICYEHICEIDPAKKEEATRRINYAKELAKTTRKRNQYEVLGLKQNFTPEELKVAYKQKARAHHPDRHSDADVVTRRIHEKIFKEASEANSYFRKRFGYN